MNHLSFLFVFSALLPALLLDRRVDAIECLYCYQEGPNAEETCSDVQYERECAPGSVCFSQRTKEYGKTTAFERSCAPEIECSTACLTNGACTYCCHSNLCNNPQHDRLIPGSSVFSSTDNVVLITGCIIALFTFIVFVMLFIRCQKKLRQLRRSRLQLYRSRASGDDFSVMGNDQQQLLGEERALAGLPPTYDEATEDPPAYRVKEEDDKSEDGVSSVAAAAADGVIGACDVSQSGEDKEE